MVRLRPSASNRSAHETAYTTGLVTRFEHPSAVAEAVADYLPRSADSSFLVRLRWFAEVLKAQRTFDSHAFPNAARCPELVLLLEESWVPVEDVLDTALVWHIDDVESGAFPIEGMASAYVIANEQTRKRKASGGTLGAFRLSPVNSAQWTALPEDKPTALDRLAVVGVHQPPGRALGDIDAGSCTAGCRRRGQGAGPSRCCRSRPGSGTCSPAGSPPPVPDRRRCSRWTLESGWRWAGARPSVRPRPRACTRAASRAEERRAVDAVLGRAWDWARAERHLKGADVGPSGGGRRKRKEATVVFKWRRASRL